MDRVFVYWDHSNVFHEDQCLAEEREGMPGARYLVRIHFENLLGLAEAERPLAKADDGLEIRPLRRRQRAAAPSSAGFRHLVIWPRRRVQAACT